jgi:hypothetical protein
MISGRMKALMICAAAMAMSEGAGAARAEDALMDDFESGMAQNQFFSYWYFYNDAANQGTSKVNSAAAGPGTDLIFDPSVSLAPDEGGGSAALIDYEMGPSPLSCGASCTFGQFVGFGADFASGKRALDLTGATKITYKAKASAPMTVVVQLAITSVTSKTDDQQYALHEVTHNIGTAWKTFDVILSGAGAVKQPSWAKPAIPFNPKEAEKISWKISMDAASNPKKGTLLIDSVVVRNYTWKNPDDCLDCAAVRGSLPGSSRGLSARASGGTLQASFDFPAGRNVGAAELLDLRGRVLSRANLDVAGGSRSFAMPLQGASKGVHILRLRTVNGAGSSTVASAGLTLLD